MKPPRSILDPEFAYTNSAQTSLEKTFARIRREIRAEQQRNAANDQEATEKVAPLKRSSK